LEVLYGFSPDVSQVVFNLADSLGISLKDAFVFADDVLDFINYSDRYISDLFLTVPLEADSEFALDELYVTNPDPLLMMAFSDPFVQFVYFKCRIPLESAHEITNYWLKMPKEEIMKMDTALLREYSKTCGIGFSRFKDAHEYYMANAEDYYTEEDYNKFIDYLHIGYSKEAAFECLTPIDPDELDEIEYEMNEMDIDDFLDEYDPIERMAEEIEQSYNTRFDEENDYYENDWFISKYFDS